MDKIPLHRRASWGKSQQSYDVYMRNDMAKTRSPTSSQDYGIGNFSYDAKYLKDWLLPEEPIKSSRLPGQIREKVSDWTTSGAALDTALERIDELMAEGMYRGWPDQKHTHLKVRHWPSPTKPGAQAPTIPNPVTPLMLFPEALERNDYTLPYNHKPGMPGRPPMGMESPPFTPVNAPTTPSNGTEGAPATLPDLSKINTQLSPINNAAFASPVTDVYTPDTMAPTPKAAVFDEHAWETYCNQVKAEHSDIRFNALSRLKGTARDIDSLSTEYSHMSDYAEVMRMFKLWWDGQRPKAKLYEDKVKSLELPNLEQAKRDRFVKGLSV